MSRGVLGPDEIGGGSSPTMWNRAGGAGTLQRGDDERQHRDRNGDTSRALARWNPRNPVEDDASIHLTSRSGRQVLGKSTGFCAITRRPQQLKK